MRVHETYQSLPIHVLMHLQLTPAMGVYLLVVIALGPHPLWTARSSPVHRSPFVLSLIVPSRRSERPLFFSSCSHPNLDSLRPKPEYKSGIATVCDLSTRLLKRKRDEEEEPSSTRAAKEQTQEQGSDKANKVEDTATQKCDTPSEKDAAEHHASAANVREHSAHPIPYNKYLPHFPLNPTPSRQIYDAHLQHASIKPKDLHDLIAYHHAIHNAAHLHGYYSSAKHGKSYTTTTTHTFVHKGQGRGLH
ncbi:hypothetical protein CPB85DRAFT_1254419 [Mucidula mucida]|nr:hypothetical protein CPB85DRAFT_1254419 [Mucidula mucida]